MVAAFMIGPFSIACLEMYIKDNHIDMSAGPITAAGQLIPLIIGAYVLFTIVMSLLKKPFVPMGEYIWKSTTERTLKSLGRTCPDEEMGVVGGENQDGEREGQPEEPRRTDDEGVMIRRVYRDEGTQSERFPWEQVENYPWDSQSMSSSSSFHLRRSKIL